jgi:TonB-dependent starch-binding outer membrane protein SusC
MKRLSLVFAMMCFAVVFAIAQRTVVGTVQDESGEALIGASVAAKGTTTGTVTDVNGKFSLNVPREANTLVVSYTGYTTQELTLGTSNVMDVTLESGAVITEIVVTGTGAGTDKRKVPFDIQTISSKQMPVTPTSSIDQALVGKIAGAQISSVNGTPGAAVSILLRGVNTINSGTSPMIMLDGVELGATDLNTVDFESIDRVEVVQGATGGSVYGAQGANGVIQMFTKRGGEGKVKIDFISSYSANSYLNIGGVKKANLHGFKTNANNEVVSAGGDPLSYDNSTGTYSSNLDWQSTDVATQINKPYDKNLQYFDHLDMFMQSTGTISNALSFSGGKGGFDFFTSMSNLAAESNLVGNGKYNRTNMTNNMGIQLMKNLSFRTITQLAYTKNTINDAGQNGTIFAMFNTRPFMNYAQKMDDGNYAAFLGSAGGPNATNPFYINQYTKAERLRYDIAQSFNLNFKPTKWLELDSKYGLNYQSNINRFRVENQSLNANYLETGRYTTGIFIDSEFGEIDDLRATNQFQNFLTSATLRFDLPSSIKSTTYGAWDYRNRIVKNLGSSVSGLPTYQPYTSAQGTSSKVQFDVTTPFVTYGYVISQKFDIGEWGGVSGGFRSDWSSAFGAGSKPFTFPRGDAYLRLSELPFWKNQRLGEIFPEFKLRGGFGTAGIQPKPFDRYVTLGTATLGSSNAFFNNPNQSNPNLEVEISKEVEFGADFIIGLAKGNWFRALSIQPTYWSRSTNNAIWDVDGIPSAGISTYKNNTFGLSSSGIQVALGLQIAESKNFAWHTTVNIGKQSSKISKITGPPVVVQTAAGSTGYILEEGTKVGQLFGYLGLHDVKAKDEDGNYYIPEAEWSNFEVASNGWVVDLTKRAPYFTQKQYSFGDPNPKFILNFINDVKIKDFLTIGFQFDWVHGSHLYNQTKEWMYRDGIHSDYQVPLTIGGTTGAWSSFYRGVYAERARNGTKSYFYEDASFVRLRNLEFGVELGKLSNVNALRRVQVVLSGRNLLTFTKYTGLDPEINSSNSYNGGNSAWDRGTDHNTMPNLRSYQISLKIGI